MQVTRRIGGEKFPWPNNFAETVPARPVVSFDEVRGFDWVLGSCSVLNGVLGRAA